MTTNSLRTLGGGLVLTVIAVSGMPAQQGPQPAPPPQQLLPPSPPPPMAATQKPAPMPQTLPTVPISQLDERLPTAAREKEQTFSLSFAEPVAIRDLLLLMVRDTPMSVVIDPDIAEGTFTGELKNVTLQQALDSALKPLGLQYTIDENILRVSRRQVETRLYHVNYVATRRTGTRGVTANSGMGGLASGFGQAGVSGGSSFGAGAGNAGFGGGGGIGGGEATVNATDSTDFFQELQTGVQTLISQDGKFNLDRKAGVLQVTDYDDRLDKIANYVDTVIMRVNRQVRIQAKVLEVNLNRDSSAGINWTLVLSSAGNSVSLTQNLAPTNVPGAFTIGVNVRDFTGMMRAFQTQGDVNVLSSPWVTAMNNEPAIIRVGTQDIFFVTTSQVDATTGRILQSAVTPQAITEGVVLSVTAQISADGIINMSVTPTITERTGQATSRLGDKVPIVSVRETDTLVRVREGETIVIGGLMQDRVTKDRTKVPLLGDLPFVGALFRQDTNAKRKTELVVLLTPTVMTPAEIAADAAREQQRMYEIQKAPLPGAKQ